MNLKAYRFDALLYFCNFIIASFPSARVRHMFYKSVMKIEMAKSAHILSGAWLDTRGNLSIGENSVINQRCRLDNRGGIEIGANVSISPEVHIITADHDPESDEFAGRMKKVTIGNHVFIGSRATILPGVCIGNGAVVAAGALVTKSVEPLSVVAGIPAKTIKKRNSKLGYSLNYRRHFF